MEGGSTASAEVELATGISIISAHVTVTLGDSASSGLILGAIDGERIEKVRVSAEFGKGSSLTLITASGREIPSDGRSAM
jgi:hypothetical protein